MWVDTDQVALPASDIAHDRPRSQRKGIFSESSQAWPAADTVLTLGSTRHPDPLFRRRVCLSRQTWRVRATMRSYTSVRGLMHEINAGGGRCRHSR